MSVSRKRKKELKKLRHSAEELWSDQQHVVDRASQVAREARRQATFLAREHVTPRVRHHYEQHVVPHLSSASRVARSAGNVIEKTIVPAMGTALGTALSVADVAKDTRLHAAIQRAHPKMSRKKPSGAGASAYIAIGIGAVAIVGVAYAMWQTFRADDELWVSDDADDDNGAYDDANHGVGA